MRPHFRPVFACGVVLALIFLTTAVQPVDGQKNSLTPDVLAANQELDRQLMEGHKLLDTDKVMHLFSTSSEVSFVAPDGAVNKGREQVRRSWEQFFATLQSIEGQINEISYIPVGDGVIAVGRVTYHRQLKNGSPEQRVVVWTDYRRKENGKWVYVFRHAHSPVTRDSPSPYD